MIEIKTMDIPNWQETHYTELYLNFGWSLKSSQRIFNRDSHLESRNDSLYSVTETVNYTKLVFERDTDRPNYYALKTLETNYHNIESVLPKISPPTVPETPEQWGEKTSPNVVVESHVIPGIIVGSILGFVGDFILTELLNPGVAMSISAVIGCLFWGAVAGWIAAKITNQLDISNALKKAIKEPQSAEHALLVKLYEDAKSKRESYENKLAEMQNLRNRAKQLL